ncbi:MAG: DNA-processing protein DprA [Erysipelotrichaceae bacterium]|nr:DNA-processing protein DprA [Erysipelotrichaceae bacterium]
MKREELIAYSFYYGGEYNKVYQAIKENKKIAPLKIDNAVTILDDHYPRAFLDLKYPPFVFYYYGDLDLFNKQIYGIVGSRDPCPLRSSGNNGFGDALFRQGHRFRIGQGDRCACPPLCR